MPHIFKMFLVFLFSLIATILILPHLSKIASRIDLVDQPGRRKVHNVPKPLIGGLGMIIVVSLSAVFFIPLPYLKGFFAGMIILGIIGFLDDFKDLGHRLKFGPQILASIAMMYFSNTFLFSFGDIFSTGQVLLGVFTIPLTIFCTVGVINAINMIDGLDGLAGGVSLIAFFSFAMLSYINNQPELMLLSIVFIGSVIGFLRYNWQPSRLFMGDAGSLFLGFSMAFLSLAITQKSNSIVPPMAPLLILAVPIVDTVIIMTKRAMTGKSPFHADKTHLHHLLLRLGLGKRQSVITILLLSLLSSSVAILGALLHIPDYYLFLIFSIYFIFCFITSFFIKDMLRHKKTLSVITGPAIR